MFGRFNMCHVKKSPCFPKNLLSEQEISVLQRQSLPADIRLLMCSDYFDSPLEKLLR